MWTAAAIAIPSAGALLWWLSEKGYNSLTPYKASNAILAAAAGAALCSHSGLLGITGTPGEDLVLTVLLVLLQYHYRPGSFSAWVADILEGHSKRRRSELLLPLHTLLSSQSHIASLSESSPLHTCPVHPVLVHISAEAV